MATRGQNDPLIALWVGGYLSAVSMAVSSQAQGKIRVQSLECELERRRMDDSIDRLLIGILDMVRAYNAGIGPRTERRHLDSPHGAIFVRAGMWEMSTLEGPETVRTLTMVTMKLPDARSGQFLNKLITQVEEFTDRTKLVLRVEDADSQLSALLLGRGYSRGTGEPECFYRMPSAQTKIDMHLPS